MVISSRHTYCAKRSLYWKNILTILEQKCQALIISIISLHVGVKVLYQEFAKVGHFCRTYGSQGSAESPWQHTTKDSEHIYYFAAVLILNGRISSCSYHRRPTVMEIPCIYPLFWDSRWREWSLTVMSGWFASTNLHIKGPLLFSTLVFP